MITYNNILMHAQLKLEETKWQTQHGGNQRKKILQSKTVWASIGGAICGALILGGYGEVASGVGLIFMAFTGIDIRRKLKE